LRNKFIASIVFSFLLVLSFAIAPSSTFAAIADGTYKINYEMKEANSDNTSIADGYFTKPATLTVKNGVQYITLTVTGSNYIKSLSAPSGPVEIISEDTEKLTRTVRFKVDGDLSQPLNMKMHIVVPDVYDTTHIARAIFDVKGLPEKKENTNVGQNTNNDKKQDNKDKKDDKKQDKKEDKKQDPPKTDTKKETKTETNEKPKDEQDTEKGNTDKKDEPEKVVNNESDKNEEKVNEEETPVKEVAEDKKEAGETEVATDSSVENSQQNNSNSSSGIIWISIIILVVVIGAGFTVWKLSKNKKVK